MGLENLTEGPAMRTFVAIELPPHIRDALAELSAELRKVPVRASWVQPDRIHLTLRFLGKISPEIVERLGDMLAQDYAGHECFTLRVKGAGAFPGFRKPRVVWAGVEPVEGTLTSAHRIADQAAKAVGVPQDSKRFNPHLTLARIRDIANAEPLGTALESHRSFNGGAFEVRRVALFSSRLTPKGAVYQQLREFPF